MCRHMYLHREFFYAVFWHKTFMSLCYLCCIRSRVHAYSRSRYHNHYRYVACRTPVTYNNSKLCHFEYCVRMNDRNHTNRRNLHGFEPHCDAIWQNKKNERTIHSWVESMVSFFPSRWWWKMRKLHQFIIQTRSSFRNTFTQWTELCGKWLKKENLRELVWDRLIRRMPECSEYFGCSWSVVGPSRNKTSFYIYWIHFLHNFVFYCFI